MVKEEPQLPTGWSNSTALWGTEFGSVWEFRCADKSLKKCTNTSKFTRVCLSSLAGLGIFTGCVGVYNHVYVWGDYLVRWEWSSGSEQRVLRPLRLCALWLGRYLGLIQFGSLNLPITLVVHCFKLLSRSRGWSTSDIRAVVWTRPRCSKWGGAGDWLLFWIRLPAAPVSTSVAGWSLSIGEMTAVGFHNSVQQQHRSADHILFQAVSHRLQLWSKEPSLGFRGCSPWRRWPLAWRLRLLTGHPHLIPSAPPVAWILTVTVLIAFPCLSFTDFTPKKDDLCTFRSEFTCCFCCSFQTMALISLLWNGTIRCFLIYQCSWL